MKWMEMTPKQQGVSQERSLNDEITPKARAVIRDGTKAVPA